MSGGRERQAGAGKPGIIGSGADTPGPTLWTPSALVQKVSLREYAVAVTGGQFMWLPHLKSLEEMLQAVADDEHEDFETSIVAEPPRSGKSWLGCRIFPAYYLYRWPERKVIIGAHTGALAWRHSLVALTYFEMTPSCRSSLIRGARTGGWWMTKQGGQCFSIGRDTWVLGQGYDVCCIDDPFSREARALSQREQEQAFAWWKELARREEVAWLQKSKPNRILFQQRIADQDLAGKIIAEEEERGRPLYIVHQPALEPVGEDFQYPESATVAPRATAEPGESTMPRLRTTEDLEKRRQDDPVRFDAVYQQNPRKGGGDIWFVTEHIHDWPQWQPYPPERGDGFQLGRRIRAWDFAFKRNQKANWTVGLLMRRLKITDRARAERFFEKFPTTYEWLLVVENVIRVRVSAEALDALIVDTAKADGEFVEVSFPIDPAHGERTAKQLRNAVKKAVCTETGYERSPRCHLIPTNKSKADRAWRHKTVANRGQVFLLPGPWNGAYRSELSRFQGEEAEGITDYDDQVDAASDAVNKIAPPVRRVAKRQSAATD